VDQSGTSVPVPYAAEAAFCSVVVVALPRSYQAIYLLLPLSLLAASCAGHIKVDAAKMALAKERLAPIVREFDSVHAPEGTQVAGHAVLDAHCAEDSGDILQPEVVREFSRAQPPRATSVASIGQELSHALVAQGWVVARPLTPAGQIRLERTFPDHSLSAEITVFADSVFLTAETGLQPCYR
jgi:hypothetical protein